MKLSHGLLMLMALVSFCGAATRPNIVVIVADDLGYNDVSFHGSNQIPTPNIDSLAYEGIILNNYYVSPICTPTRGALMSGRHPIHTGLQHSVIYSSEKYGLPLEEKIMPQWFNELGYRSHIVGKWHLGFYAEEFTPLFRGFETHYGYLLGHGDYFDHMAECTPEYWGLDWRRNLDLLRNETNLYSTDLFAQEAVNIINKHNTSEPLFLYLPHQAVHSGNTEGDPLQAPQHYVDRFPHINNYHRRLFAGMLAALDDAVGSVVNTLKARGMYDNTVIVFTTDNGGPSNGFDANAANNFPLRGVKATQWEGGLRGVGFIASPLLNQTGYVSNHMLHVCDWLPTLYEAAGGDPTKMANLDGSSEWQSLSHNQPGNRQEILHNIDPSGKGQMGLRVGDYKIVVGDIGMAWSDWYPPWTSPGDSLELHVNNSALFKYFTAKDEQMQVLSGEAFKNSVFDKNTQYFANSMAGNRGSDDLMEEDNDETLKFVKYHKPLHTVGKPMPKSTLKSYRHFGNPVKIDCGQKPFNASTNCDPRQSPCLFHIASDPCEYNNIAAGNQGLVVLLLTRLMQCEDTMVPPLNTPVDPAGNPKYHDGAWVPWVKL
ncbi:arylsulfatase J-like isoform X3 [Dreissena polymorpha]|uniref:arylsulfatase J-like isoform X3 n=1 Tax=Dreissena polymorpha TaxID=45954 RepID=UPI0022640594|nr:arylsulfatase J-like isoform X3 [Dreissena polymorpha]